MRSLTMMRPEAMATIFTLPTIDQTSAMVNRAMMPNAKRRGRVHRGVLQAQGGGQKGHLVSQPLGACQLRGVSPGGAEMDF